MFFTVPEHAHRIVAVRRSPVGAVSTHAAAMAAFLEAVGGLPAPLYPFFRYGSGYEIVLCDPARDMLPLLEGSRISWAVRGPEDPSHRTRLVNARDGGDEADIVTSFVLDGEEPRVSPGVVVEMRLGRFVEGAAERPEPRGLLAVFEALVRAFQPDFGFVEPAGTADPAPPRPDAPVVRWLTYLSRAWPKTADLAPVNASFPIDDLGTAYLATSDLASASEIPQKQALAQLQRALVAVLEPLASPREPVPPPPEPPRPAVVPSTLSFLQHAPAPPQPVDPPPLNLEQYASLTAELSVYAERGDEIMARYGVTSRAALAALHAAYRAQLEADPEAAATFRDVQTQYTDWFSRSKWSD